MWKDWKRKTPPHGLTPVGPSHDSPVPWLPRPSFIFRRTRPSSFGTRAAAASHASSFICLRDRSRWFDACGVLLPVEREMRAWLGAHDHKFKDNHTFSNNHNLGKTGHGHQFVATLLEPQTTSKLSNGLESDFSQVSLVDLGLTKIILFIVY